MAERQSQPVPDSGGPIAAHASIRVQSARHAEPPADSAAPADPICSSHTQVGKRCDRIAGTSGLCGLHSRQRGGSKVVDPLEIADWSRPAEALASAGLVRSCDPQNRRAGP